MEVSQLWSVLYFFMLLMLGIGSMLGNTAAILTPLTDSKVVSSHLPKEAISGERARPWGMWGSGRARRGAQADGRALWSLVLGAVWDSECVTRLCLWFFITGKGGGREGQT